MKNTFDFISEEELLNCNGGGRVYDEIIKWGLSHMPGCVSSARGLGKALGSASNPTPTGSPTTWSR